QRSEHQRRPVLSGVQGHAAAARIHHLRQDPARRPGHPGQNRQGRCRRWRRGRPARDRSHHHVGPTGLMTMKLTRIAAMLAMLAFAATATSCTHHKSGDAAATTSSSAAPTSTRAPVAPVTGPALPPFFPSPAANAAPPPTPGKASADPAQVGLTVVTDRGRIGLQLANNESPCTVNSFVTLAQGAYFDNTECHRLTTSRTLSVLQCGDPKGDGTGGHGYQFADA